MKDTEKVEEEVKRLRDRVAELEAELERRVGLEEELRYCEDLYNKAPDMFASVDAKTAKIGRCNQTLANALDYSKEELIGKPIPFIYHPDCEDVRKKAFRSFVETGEVKNAELQLKRKDGSKIDVILNVTSLRDEKGEVLYSSSVLRDITELKSADEELRVKREYLEKLHYSLGDAVFSVKMPERVIAFANKAVEDIFGYDPEECIGRTTSMFYPAHEGYANYGRLLENAIGRGDEIVRSEQFLKRKNGEVYPGEVTTTFFKEDGEVGGVISIVRDITERKRMEEELQRAHDELEVKVLERTSELTDTNKRLMAEITERMRVEEELQISETNLVKAQEVAHIGSWYFNLLENNLVWTDENYRIFGIPKGTPMTYESFIEVVHPEDRDYVDKKWIAAIEGEPYDIEHRLLVGNEVKWVREKAELNFDDKGNVTTGVGITQDITERKRAEEALLESEERLKTIYEHALFGIAMIGKELKPVFTNRAFQEMLGYSEEELHDMRITDFTHPEDVDETQRMSSKLLERKSDSLRLEKRYIRKNGDIMWGHVTVSIIRDATGEMRYSIAMLEDITERKRAEEALLESETRFRGVFESKVIGNLFWDADGSITDANDAFLEIVGYTRDEVLSGTVRWVDMTPPEFKEQDDKALQEIIDTGVTTPFEKEYICKDGTRVPVLVGAASLPGPTVSGVAFAIDISERKRAEEALKESEERYRGVIDNIGIGISLISPNMEVLTLNKQMKRWFPHIDVSKKPICYKVFNNPPREEVCSYCPTYESLKDGQVHESETETPAGDEVRNYRIVASPLRDREGNVVAAIEMVEDITERKRAEEALQISETNLVKAQEVAHIGSWYLNLLENNLVWTDENYRIFGIPKGTPMTYEGFVDVVHPEDRDYVDKKWTAAIEGEPYDIEHRLLIGNEVKWVREKAELNFDDKGNPISAVGITQDITERKLAEEELRESEEKYRTLFEESKDVVFMSSIDGKILDINSAGLELFGYASKEESKKVDIARDCYRNQADRERFKQEVARNGFVRDFEVEVRKRDGDKRSVLMTANAVRDGKGEIVAYWGILHDITEQKSLQQQLIQAQKMEAVGELTGGIAHDFRNILTVIQGNAQILMRKIGDDDELMTCAEMIVKSSNKATNLIKGLLAFSRKQPITLNPVKMSRIINDVGQLLSRIIEEDIELRTSCSKENLTVMADEGQLEQILVNLATNARDAMPGGGALTISVEAAELDYEFVRLHPYFEPGRYCCITVQDTGIGMDEETKNKVFEPFFSTKEVGKGTGLGLSIVYGIIEQHNGHINLDSEVGKGTTFKVFLPIVDAGQETEQIQRQTPLTGTETILLAEDNMDVRKVTKGMVEGFGYKVIEAVDGEDAVDKFKEFKDEIRLLILDGVMPKKSGKEAFNTIKKINPEIKALFLSGYSLDIVNKDEDLDEGSSFLSKPVSEIELFKRMRELLDNRLLGV